MIFLLGIVLLITPAESNCPNNQTCDCNFDYVNCTCLQRENITVEEAGGKPFLLKEFIISGCGKVKLNYYSLNELHVKSIYLTDLLELHIEQYAFVNGWIINFNISNVKVLKLDAAAFRTIKVITNLIISNVTSDELGSGSIAGVPFTNLVIEDSHIDVVKRSSLVVDKSETITIKNNQIDTIEEYAFTIKSFINKFSFILNNVNATKSYSFSLYSAKEIDFGYCRFEQIAQEMIFSKNVNSFSFYNSSIRNCEEGAFWKVEPKEQFLFVDNQVLLAKNNSLIPNYGRYKQNSRVIVLENNQIGCTCNIRWLIENSNFETIRKKNVCLHPQHLKGTNLSQLKMFFNKNGNCIAVDDLSATGVPAITETVEELTTLPSTTVSREDNINQTVSSTTQQIISYQNQSKGNSGNIYACNGILLFSLLIFYPLTTIYFQA